ncbi:pyruvate dehydrogenase complex dihydrolipoamide acetyltransferase [Flavipsychrobacter stenotrophus]|uniref:Acetyltransferase component of pyruvate dehydrogenase complex n=1 Tax=Flavipsychrobacter stenotrophus TaxID=2077091 RepID=A0A2S7T156_9BACT|nr:pyruvate dehydrogenase complex dihydrolipoamide acetyltransferase [Flavipsychrobacter stenotrophus]PQJ12932.1 pyruvate dehydrogenase complex dihydrolipoamide acetyltransferase [Flavipsychrobacter stenotrophus]
MAEAIRMPLLSDTMKEGVIAEWHKKVGDEVKADDVIANVETDKATMEVTPYVDGTLLYIAVDKGQGVPINGIMAIIGKPGEDFQSIIDNEKKATPAAAPAQPAPAAAPAQANAAPAAPVAEQPAAPQANVAPAAPVAEATPAAAPNPGDANATVVRMPLLSDTMKEGKIVAWHKQVGDVVKGDDAIADVETDKATMEVMPYADGVLLYIGVKEGDAAKINDIIAIVGKAGTDVTPYLDKPGGAPSAAPQQQTPAQPAQQNAMPAAPVAAPAVQPAAPAQPVMASGVHPESAEGSKHDNAGGRVIASPLAKKLASDKGIDIQQLVGSGDNGRIIKRDIDTFKAPAAQQAQPVVASSSNQAQPAQAAQAPKASAAPFVPAVQGTEGHTDTPVSQMRRIIAQRLAESKFSAPHFYLRMSITMDKAIEARKAINDVSPVKVSFNDLIIKACAMALRKHPAVNSSWMGDFIRQNHHINIGTAVAVEEGLIVPVIKFADQKTLSQISEEANVLIEKARTKKIQPQEFTGNTFTISNLGMMDMDEFTAIINPPDACILAVGKIAPTPVVENNQVVIRQILKLTLSCDHRVVDGAVGARFMQTLKSHLENPVTMLV